MVGLEVLQWNLGMLCLKIWLVGVLGQWESPAICCSPVVRKRVFRSNCGDKFVHLFSTYTCCGWPLFFRIGRVSVELPGKFSDAGIVAIAKYLPHALPGYTIFQDTFGFSTPTCFTQTSAFSDGSKRGIECFQVYKLGDRTCVILPLMFVSALGGQL